MELDQGHFLKRPLKHRYLALIVIYQTHPAQKWGYSFHLQSVLEFFYMHWFAYPCGLIHLGPRLLYHHEKYGLEFGARGVYAFYLARHTLALYPDNLWALSHSLKGHETHHHQVSEGQSTLEEQMVIL